LEDGEAGIAYADITTGEFAVTELKQRDSAAAARHEATRLNPAELLVAEESPLVDQWKGNLTEWPDWRFEYDRANSQLQEHFGTATLDGFGLGDMVCGLQAAGAIIDYLAQTQPAALTLLSSLSTYTLDDFMALDGATRRNLELTETLRSGEVRGSLLHIVDMTLTPMGKRLLRQWIGKPLLDAGKINHRLDQVQAFFEDGLWRADIRAALQPLGDLERLSNRTVAGVALPRDLAAMRELLGQIPPVLAVLDGERAPAVNALVKEIDLCQEVVDLLHLGLEEEPPATLANIGVIRPGYDDELDAVREASQAARDWIANLESVERERTGIKSLKVGYNKVFGYYIEVTKANTDSVPEEYVRKQTLVNAERYITPEMKDYESQVLNAEEEIREIENRLFNQLCQEIAGYAPKLLHTARSLARLDVVSALAETAIAKNYVRPQIFDDERLDIRLGRHPVVEQYLQSTRFVPNDLVFEEGERIRIITGPNMSGKSTYLRQAALIVLLAQMGSFVPAQSADIGLVDRIFTRIGAQDEIHAGQSTFMVEMVETARILHHATPRSLLILDEIGRGTSTYDGLSIAWAVIEYLHSHPDMRARTLFATHYHELTRLSESLPGVRNHNVAVSEEGGQVVFLHRIMPGGADKSYGIHVAELAGLPRPVLNRAQEILQQLEKDGASPHERKGEASQMTFLPALDPLLEELKKLDLNSLSPLEALNTLYEWQSRFDSEDELE
jgi:DNA mismatch repair protein MutS